MSEAITEQLVLTKEQEAMSNAEYLLENVLGLNKEKNLQGKRGKSADPQAVEHLGIVTNEESDPKVAEILAEAAKKLNAKVTILHFRDSKDDKDVFARQFAQSGFDVAIRLATDCVQLSNELAAIAEEKGISMPEMPGLTVDSLASKVFAESPQAMRERGKELLKILSHVKKLHLKSGDGTDLWLEVDPSEKWISEPADFSRRGKGSPVENLPGTEIYKNLLAKATEGTLVLYYLDSYVDPEVIVDQPVVLRYYHGRVVSIKDGEAAEKLRNYIQEKSKQDKDPTAAYRASEIAIGLNSLARSYEEAKAVPTIETEKMMRLHLANGDSPVKDENLAKRTNMITSELHLDFVLPRIHEVEAELDDGTKITLFGPAGSLERYGK